MRPDRTRRVDEALREVLGDVIAREMKDPRIGFATVTQVRTSADLRHARVLISVLPTEAADGEEPASPRDTIRGLESAVGFLQRRVADELELRYTPLLRFELDDTVDTALRIQSLLEAEPERPLEVELPEGPADAPSTDVEREDPGGGPPR